MVRFEYTYKPSSKFFWATMPGIIRDLIVCYRFNKTALFKFP